MYDIPYFKAAHADDVLAFMKAHPFGLICGVGEAGRPVATQIPFLFEQRGDQLFLQGHFMKKQDHTHAFISNPNALVVFSGAHTYVSASWYENKKVASTWNYQSVHATGKIIFRDETFLHQLLIRLTDTFEMPGSESKVQHMDPEYVSQMIRAIIGFEMEVLEVRHVFKLSQNRDEKTQANIIAKLGQQEGDSQAIARAMESNKKISP